MATTKRDFEAVASILSVVRAGCNTRGEKTTVELVACNLADYFASQNERFKRDQFLTASGVGA